MAIDRREDAGEFYPGGKVVSTRPVATGGDMKHSDFAGIEPLPERFTDEDVRTRFNQLVSVAKGASAAVALLLGTAAFGAGVTVQTAPKGQVYNDEQIVTNVTWSADGLATTEEVDRVARDAAQNLAAVAQSGTNYTDSATNGLLRTEMDPTVPSWAKSSTQPLPPNYSTVSNRAMTALQSYTETDPTVPAWAKATSKPSYSWSEITSKPSLATVATSGSYNDLSNKPTIPTVPTAQINAATTTNALQDAAIAGKASTNDVVLTEVSGFSEWVFPGFPEIDEYSEKNLVPYENAQDISLEYWVRDKDWETGEWGDWYLLSSSDNHAPLDATSFTWLIPMGGEEPNEYTGTRTAQSGYQLGGDTNHILAAQSDLARLATNTYTKAETDAAIPTSAADLGAVPVTRTVNGKALSANVSLSASDVGAATAEDVYRIVAGTNVILVVTNYNSAVHAPAMKLQHLDPQSGQYVTYWDETRRHGLTLTNAMHYTDAQIETRAPRAWSGTTSGLGSEAPAGVTWISTPETVIAGGYEYEKVVTSAGAVWVLASNGLATGATTNSFFRVSASDGTELFSIEKTDSYLVGVNADGITRSGNTVTIPMNVVANEHPYIRATTNIVDAAWVKEDENGFACPWASVSWSGTTGAYVATVTCSQPPAFFYFEYLQEGGAKVRNSAATELAGGIIFNGDVYMPTVNGNKLEFVRQL